MVNQATVRIGGNICSVTETESGEIQWKIITPTEDWKGFPPEVLQEFVKEREGMYNRWYGRVSAEFNKQSKYGLVRGAVEEAVIFGGAEIISVDGDEGEDGAIY